MFFNGRIWLVLICLLGGGGLVFGLWAGLGQAAPTAVATPTAAEVDISGFAYDPPVITVSVDTTVTWTNLDTASHNVTGSNWGSGDFGQGGSYSRVFTETGTFDYICTIHPFMEGTVEVMAAPVVTPTNFLPLILGQ